MLPMKLDLCLVLTLTVVGCASEAQTKAATFDQTLADAAREKKIAVVDFFTTWCGPCKKLDATTWKDPDVVRWMEAHGAFVAVDAEREVALARRFKVNAYPTILLLKPDGTLIDRLVGYRDAKTFLAEVNDAIAGKDALARAKEKLVGHEHDPIVRQSFGDELARKERNDEALVEYLWCFDNGRESPGYYGVRLSFLLADIARLGAKHPPALDALKARRDAAETKALADADYASAIDALALNRVLSAPERNFALYERVRTSPPSFKRLKGSLCSEVLPALIGAKRYAEALELLDGPVEHVARELRSFQVTAPIVEEDEALKTALAIATAERRKSCVRECSLVYEAVIGTSNMNEGERIADQLIEFEPTALTYSGLVAAAARAGAADEARAIAERGLKSLPESEHEGVQHALDAVPPKHD